MRVGYVLNQYPTVSGTFILGEVKALRERGVEVDTFAINAAGPGDMITDEARAEGARTEALIPGRPLRVLRALLGALVRAPGALLGTLRLALSLRPPGLRGAAWQLLYLVGAVVVWDRCRRRGVEHLHAHFSFLAADVALLAAALGERAGSGPSTFSFTVHGPDELMDLSRTRLRAKAERAARVVCISHFARSQVLAQLAEADWDKVARIHCGIDVAAYRPVERAERGGRLRVLNVGRLVAVKGQAVLVRAVRRLRDEGVDVHVDFVGDGPSRDAIAELAERLGVADAITLHGSIGQDRIGSFYAAADVFCVPSFAEGLPIVIMEALGTELPVVSTSVMGIPELVEDGVSGLLVPPGDEAALAAALRRMAERPDERRRLAAEGRRRVASEFDVRRTAEELERLFASATAPDRGFYHGPSA